MSVIGRRLAHYEILSKLGDGGMGVVYKARDTHLDRFVAIKLLPPEFVADADRKRRFTQEAKAASALNHPSIVTVHDITQADGTDFIAMEYVQGKTLGELIGRKGLRLKDTLSYAIQAAGALVKAHAAGIVHRDLKPSNIMVTDDDLVKILDFGVAKLTATDSVEHDEAPPTHTMTVKEYLHTEAGKIVGTVAYMSPEQADGKPVDPRSDIFSFGAVLYEMVTGTRAFQGTSSVQTLAAVMTEEPKLPSQLAKDLPHELERIILRCLRKDPVRRFQVMADVAVELEEIETESGTHLAAAQRPARTWSTRWLIASALMIIVLAVSGVWILWPKPTAPLAPPSVEPLTSLAGDERYPTLSPDGNQVAFAWNGEQGDNQDIYVLSVGAGRPLRLTDDAAEDYAPAWSPDGSQIAFLRRQGPKVAVYLSPPVPGSERKLTEVDDAAWRLRPFSWYVPVTVSWFPDGKRLVVSDRDGKMAGIVIIPVDHGEPKRLISTPASGGAYHWPTVSPTGRLLAYASCDSDATFGCDVSVMELTHDLTVKGAARQLTTQNSTVYGIAWTADGSAIVYGSGVFTRPYLWRVGVGGGEPERLELADRAGYPAISWASNRLAFTRFTPGADIWKLDANGPPQPFLSSTLDDRNAQFSPDGKRIAFESSRLGKDSQIWVANSDGTNAAPLYEGAKGVWGSPRWSPDSRSIAFDGQGEDGRQGVYVIDAAGGQPRLLVSPGSLPCWSHDGKWIFFASSRAGRPEVWRVSLAGGDAVQMTDSEGGNPLVPPDGRTLYYRRNLDASALLFALPMGGGPAHQILDTMSAGILQYFPVDDGIYYIPVRDPKQPLAFEVRFLNFATGKQETLIRFAARFGQGLAVSPDRKTILVSGIPISAGDDLILIKNFR